jgi:hypothetical protein
LDADPRIESANPPKGLDEDEPSLPGTAHPDPPITRSRNAIVPQVSLSLPLTPPPSSPSLLIFTQHNNKRTAPTRLYSSPNHFVVEQTTKQSEEEEEEEEKKKTSTATIPSQSTKLLRKSTQNTKQKFHGFG